MGGGGTITGAGWQIRWWAASKKGAWASLLVPAHANNNDAGAENKIIQHETKAKAKQNKNKRITEKIKAKKQYQGGKGR